MGLTRIGVHWNSGKAHGLECAGELIEQLKENGLVPIPETALAQALQLSGGADIEELAEESDAIIVLGGDGTLLTVAEPAARHNVPVLGVNIGHMGFMTEITPERLPDAVKRLREGRFNIESRMMICAATEQYGVQTALNDIVFYRAANDLHIVETRISVGGAASGRMMSDGLILATPTGSTAYSLSAGGPVVDPLLDCILVTPICPHSPLSRPAVLPDWEQIVIKTPDYERPILMSTDSRASVRIEPGTSVRISKSNLRAQFIRFSQRSFYDAFRAKISEWSN